VVEVERSHSGENLAAAFAEILDEYGIAEKVSFSFSQLDLLFKFDLPTTSTHTTHF
jgi:hypothetical protein